MLFCSIDNIHLRSLPHSSFYFNATSEDTEKDDICILKENKCAIVEAS
jgi:hypothetical protein